MSSLSRHSLEVKRGKRIVEISSLRFFWVDVEVSKNYERSAILREGPHLSDASRVRSGCSFVSSVAHGSCSGMKPSLSEQLRFMCSSSELLQLKTDEVNKGRVIKRVRARALRPSDVMQGSENWRTCASVSCARRDRTRPLTDRTQRKEVHNRKERDRRRRIRLCCDELNLLVPFCYADTDKATTLQWTTAFLKYIQEIHGDCLKQVPSHTHLTHTPPHCMDHSLPQIHTGDPRRLPQTGFPENLLWQDGPAVEAQCVSDTPPGEPVHTHLTSACSHTPDLCLSSQCGAQVIAIGFTCFWWLYCMMPVRVQPVSVCSDRPRGERGHTAESSPVMFWVCKLRTFSACAGGVRH
ncbi:uncharacterized protein LOC130094974 [Rhinichthys klamathensis goyatoka]|uniref:uncharacterized protein LOC130094974 n=1 Tax=Rhinichthys klamathensis goyatoka TaxID=3034132 RepID=UPI0024B62026|nr:uncharacterized protein LOC130094974 [Rhinichthys klamathensis goyatoka]